MNFTYFLRLNLHNIWYYDNIYHIHFLMNYLHVCAFDTYVLLFYQWYHFYISNSNLKLNGPICKTLNVKSMASTLHNTCVVWLLCPRRSSRFTIPRSWPGSVPTLSPSQFQQVVTRSVHLSAASGSATLLLGQNFLSLLDKLCCCNLVIVMVNVPDSCPESQWRLGDNFRSLLL